MKDRRGCVSHIVHRPGTWWPLFPSRCFILATEPSKVTEGLLPSMDAFPLTDNKQLDPSCSLASLGTCWTSCYGLNKQMDLAIGCKDILEQAYLPTYYKEQNTVPKRDARSPGWFWMRSVVLRVWSLDQQHEHHLGTGYKWEVLVSTLNLLNRKLWGAA